MDDKPTAADIKKAWKALGDEVDLPAALREMATHRAAIDMLAEAQNADPHATREALAALAGLLDRMDAWVTPGESKPASGSAALAASPDKPEVLLDHDRVKVFIDGASKGNPGLAAVGMVFCDLEDAVIYEDARVIGTTTNNVAEYQALIAALEILVENGSPEAYFFSDSQLMVNQVRGAWKVKNPGLMPLVSRAQQLRRRLPRFQITHVRREYNRRADEIANLAIKQHRDASRM